MTTSPAPSAPIELLFVGTGTSTGLPLVPCLTRTQPYSSELARHVPLLEPEPGSESEPQPEARSRSTPVRARAPGAYDPAGAWPDNIPCACCRSAVSDDVPEGWKNRRGNTSVVVRKRAEGEGEGGGEGRWKNVVVDVGKTFKEQSGRFFPAWGVDRIDAVILTHGHADAYFGLDDLREWCVRQRSVIPIYLNKETYEMVASSFPYLVDKTKASGGGDVPSLRFHIIADDEDFEVEGIRVRALAAEHGVYFHDAHRKPLICLGFMFDESVVYMSDVSSIPESTWARMLDRRPRSKAHAQPVLTNGSHPGVHVAPQGVRANGTVIVPPTPQDTPQTPRSRSPIGALSSLSLSPSSSSPPKTNGHPRASPTPSTSPSSSASASPSLPVLIIDALWPLARHSSHTNLPEALEVALRLGAQVTYVVDVVHPVTHRMWFELGRSVALGGAEAWLADVDAGAGAGAGGAGRSFSPVGNGAGQGGKGATLPGPRDAVDLHLHPDDAQTRELVRRWWADEQVSGASGLGERLREWRGRVEPAWDGLVLRVQGERWEEVWGKGGSTKGWTR